MATISKVRQFIPAPKDGQPGAPGNDARNYDIVASAGSIPVDENGYAITPEAGITVREVVRRGDIPGQNETTDFLMTTAVVRGTDMKFFGPTNTAPSFNFSHAVVNPIDGKKADAVRVFLKDRQGVIVKTLDIVVNKKGDTGDPGEPGNPGAQGMAGPIPYPAGEWDANTSYIRTETKCPYVMWKGGYWYLTAINTVCKGIEPTAEHSQWKLADKMDFIFAKIAMMEMGKLAAAIFSGSYMFSQYGRKNGKNIDEASASANIAYKDFDASNPKDESKFVPNFFIDFLTGLLYCNKANLEGEFKVGDTNNYIELKINDQGNPVIELHCRQNEERFNLDHTMLLDPVGLRFEIYGPNYWKFIVNDDELSFASTGGPELKIDTRTGAVILGNNIVDLSKNRTIFFPMIGGLYESDIWMSDRNGYDKKKIYLDNNGFLRAE